jgi:hypothetical protein
MVRQRSPTTHTVEMAQIKEINAKLQRGSGATIMASELNIEPEPGERIEPVNPAGVLTRLSWVGPPAFPTSSGTSPHLTRRSRAEALTCTPRH